MSLTIQEFRKLSREEKEQRAGELSSHDRVIARMEDWGPPPDRPRITLDEFLTNHPKELEFITIERLERLFPEEIKRWKNDNN